MQTCSIPILLQGDEAGLDLQVEVVTIRERGMSPSHPNPYLSTVCFPWISYKHTWKCLPALGCREGKQLK